VSLGENVRRPGCYCVSEPGIYERSQPLRCRGLSLTHGHVAHGEAVEIRGQNAHRYGCHNNIML
jgi:hypothetical protein